MRHFLCAPSAPGVLARRVTQPSPVAVLVLRAGPAQRVPPTQRRARPFAIHVAAVAGTADPHLHVAVPTVVQTMRLLERRHGPPLPRDWTTPGTARITASAAMQPPFAKAREVSAKKVCPGLRFSGVPSRIAKAVSTTASWSTNAHLRGGFILGVRRGKHRNHAGSDRRLQHMTDTLRTIDEVAQRLRHRALGM